MHEEHPPSSPASHAHDVKVPNWYVLILGAAPPAEPVTLAPGITLLPLPGPLSIFDLAAAGAAGFNAWALIGQVAPACTCEIESACDSDVVPGYDTLDRAWLASSLLVLRGFGRLMPVACSAYAWSGVVESHKQSSGLPRFKGDILDFHTRMFHLPTFRDGSPTAEDAEWSRSHFDKFNSLCAASDKFRFALEAAIDWRFAKDLRTAISRMWAGIEALFGISAELVYRLSVYSAALLVARGAERTAMYIRVKKLYGIRSKAVHGDDVTHQQLTDGTAESFELLRSLLLFCIDRGHVPTESEIHRALFE